MTIDTDIDHIWVLLYYVGECEDGMDFSSYIERFMKRIGRMPTDIIMHQITWIRLGEPEKICGLNVNIKSPHLIISASYVGFL